MPDEQVDALDFLRLSLTPGLGPTLIQRGIEVLGSAEALLSADSGDLRRVPGIGQDRAAEIIRGRRRAGANAEAEIREASRRGIRLIGLTDEAYPTLLREIPAPPVVLWVWGDLEAEGLDRYRVGIVGSRRCTAYGVEQSERFGGVLAGAGLTVVSGGARGIDSAAHRSAIRLGRSVVVLGCGLGCCYPPENGPLFEAVSRSGAVISEYPMTMRPAPEHFPARNRIISGLSLGVVVIEAGRRSGALITARCAAEDQGREVMVVPGRVDSAASAGALDLLQQGAALVRSPRDVLDLLETPAHHEFVGTHQSRYTDLCVAKGERVDLGDPNTPGPVSGTDETLLGAGERILGHLSQPTALEDLVAASGMDPPVVRATITLLEIQGRVSRSGGLVAPVGVSKPARRPDKRD